ncbi:hypothetical protein Q8A67_012110 [Cirrhinus molitorella]|uniref:Uncharacterized protein n=1 Tax=Cirrhinus molitorella TaxID=172907 RepID=A0AA88PTA3_9TELE|nr:hypothetical protein Q8A67_012110 [Cirrhinus molitorella]
MRLFCCELAFAADQDLSAWLTSPCHHSAILLAHFMRAKCLPLLFQMPHCFCHSCAAHAEAALNETEYPHCEDMSLTYLHSWIALFSENDSAPCALLLSSSQEPVRKKQQGRGTRRSVSPCVPHSRLLEKLTLCFSPTQTSIPLRLRAIWSPLVGFFPEVHDEITKSCHAFVPPLPPPSPPSTALKRKDLCQPTAIKWKAEATHPSKSCSTTSALAGRAYFLA